MTYARLDDGFHENPQALDAGLTAVGLYAAATCYISRHLLDGLIPDKAIARLLEAGDMAPLDALVHVGLLVKVDGGYELHDYHPNGNETREVVLQRREAARTRAKAGGKARWAKAKRKPKAEEPETDEDEVDDIGF